MVQSKTGEIVHETLSHKTKKIITHKTGQVEWFMEQSICLASMRP
jgi:hypothetical protein